MFSPEQVAHNSWRIVDEDRRAVCSQVFYSLLAADLWCATLNHQLRESTKIKGSASFLLQILKNNREDSDGVHD